MSSRIPICPVCGGDVDVETDELLMNDIRTDHIIAVRQEWVCLDGCGTFEKPSYQEPEAPIPDSEQMGPREEPGF